MLRNFYGIIVITADRRGTVPVPGIDGQIPQQMEISDNHGNFSTQSNDPANRGGETPPLRVPTLGQVVAYFKYQSTKEMNALGGTGTITKLLATQLRVPRLRAQHIIRDEQEMSKIWDYIETNPIHWADDDENPVNIYP